jgi:hypothetical protein
MTQTAVLGGPDGRRPDCRIGVGSQFNVGLRTNEGAMAAPGSPRLAGEEATEVSTVVLRRGQRDEYLTVRFESSRYGRFAPTERLHWLFRPSYASPEGGGWALVGTPKRLDSRHPFGARQIRQVDPSSMISPWGKDEEKRQCAIRLLAPAAVLALRAAGTAAAVPSPS